MSAGCDRFVEYYFTTSTEIDRIAGNKIGIPFDELVKLVTINVLIFPVFGYFHDSNPL